MGESAKRESISQRVAGYAAITLWAAAVLFGGATLMGAHLAAFPTPPPRDPRLLAGLEGVPRTRGTHVLGVHVLSEDCGCSRAVLRSLQARTPVAGTTEHVLLVGHAPDAALNLRARGYGLEELSPESLVSRFGIESVPVFVVADRAGRVTYVGGFTRRKRDPDVRAASILQDVLRGAVPAPLPALGCAVGERMRARVDPLGIR